MDISWSVRELVGLVSFTTRNTGIPIDLEREEEREEKEESESKREGEKVINIIIVHVFHQTVDVCQMYSKTRNMINM